MLLLCRHSRTCYPLIGLAPGAAGWFKAGLCVGVVGFLIHLSTLSCSCVSSTGAMVSPVIEVLSSAALGEGCLWGC